MERDLDSLIDREMLEGLKGFIEIKNQSSGFVG